MNDIFQAIKTKTRFGFDSFEADNAGLDHYLAEERALIADHLRYGSGGLIMGGFSCIGKTEVAEPIVKNLGGTYEGHFFDINQPKGQKHYEEKHSKSIIVIDEGMSLLNLCPLSAQRLKKFLDSKQARVVLGGGIALTGAEQTQAIAQALSDFGIRAQKTQTFGVRRLSNIQIAEILIDNNKQSSHQNKKGELDINAIADVCDQIVDPLRILVHIKTCICLSNGRVTYNSGNYVIGSSESGIVPGAKQYHEQMIKLFGVK